MHKGVHVRDIDDMIDGRKSRLVVKVEVQDEEGMWRKGTADMCEACMHRIISVEFPAILALNWHKPEN